MTDRADDETADLIRRWMLTFCEMPILVDADLMRAVLNDSEAQTRTP